MKNDLRDAADLADLLRMGRLPEAWIAPPATRELRELVRHRAKLVSIRSRCKAQVHAVLAKCGVAVPMSDLFGVAGTDLLDRLELPAAYAARIASLRRIMDLLDFEIDVFARLAHGRLARDPGYTAVQTIPGIGPILGAVLVAEIGDIHRFTTPEKLTCWAGMTPLHRESDTTIRRGRITKQGSRLVRWAAVESVQRLPATTRLGAFRDAVAVKRGHNIAVVAAARRQLEYVFYALRDHHVSTDLRTPVGDCADRGGRMGGTSLMTRSWPVRGRASHDPHLAASRIRRDRHRRGRAHLIDPTGQEHREPHHARHPINHRRSARAKE